MVDAISLVRCPAFTYSTAIVLLHAAGFDDSNAVQTNRLRNVVWTATTIRWRSCVGNDFVLRACNDRGSVPYLYRHRVRLFYHFNNRECDR